MRPLRRAAGAALIFAALCFAAQRHFVVNTTRSFPPGVYRKTEDPPVRGALVVFCPPRREVFTEALRRRFLAPGLCPSGTDAMIKRIAAMEGDMVRISGRGVSVNGVTQANSAPRVRMAGGMSLPQAITLRPGEVLLLSPHPLSFDARYFGALPGGVIQSTLEPFWLWED